MYTWSHGDPVHAKVMKHHANGRYDVQYQTKEGQTVGRLSVPLDRLAYNWPLVIFVTTPRKKQQCMCLGRSDFVDVCPQSPPGNNRKHPKSTKKSQ